jgi:hypothetical protein
MRSAAVICVLSLCLASALAATPPDSPPSTGQCTTVEFTSSQAAFAAGQKYGHKDGFAAGVLSHGKVRISDGNVLLDVCDAHSYSGAYSADYNRGYQSGYDAGYAEGVAAGRNGGLGWGGGFALGFFLGLLGVIIAAVV